MYNLTRLNDKIINKVVTPVTFDYIDLSDPKNSKDHCVLIQKYAYCCTKKIKNFEVFEDDVWVITFPKCGTTWTQEMVWLLNNDLDYETALTLNHDQRFPYLELEGIAHLPGLNTISQCKNLPRPRHIKSHLPVFLLPNQLWTVKPKIVYTARNPKDVAISFYHHYRHLQGYAGTREDFIDAFLDDKVLYSPMNEHILDFWKLSKENPNILFLFYEDMKKDLDGEVKKVAKFLGKEYTQEEVDKACNHLSIDSMRKNPSCNFENMVNMIKQYGGYETAKEDFQFIREGQIGTHKKEMSEEVIKRFNKYMDCADFKEHGFSYKF